jgi:hypothetical protein
MPADKPEQRIEYEVELVEECGEIVEVLSGYRCERCHNPVEEPRPGRITRCLNPDCLNLGQLRRGGPGHKPKRFHFTYADLSKATGLSEGALRARACRKKLNPNQFASVAALLRAKNPTKEEP